jgi:hypothetical protein
MLIDPVEVVDLPINSMVIFHSCLYKSPFSHGFPMKNGDFPIRFLLTFTRPGRTNQILGVNCVESIMRQPQQATKKGTQQERKTGDYI